MREIFKVLTGSRAHGLARPDSDWDYRSIFYVPTKRLLVVPSSARPRFGTDVENHAGDGWEVEQALLMASTGHPNALELIYWPVEFIEADLVPDASELRGIMEQLVSKPAVLDATLGYVKNCLTKLLAERQPEREVKWKTTYLRTLWASWYLLRFGEYPYEVPDESVIRDAANLSVGQVIDIGREMEEECRQLVTSPREKVDWSEANEWLAGFRKSHFND